MSTATPGSGDVLTSPTTATTASGTRAAALRRARLLNRTTLVWNAAEASLSLAAGAAAGSVGLLAFGANSVIEVSAALVLAWRLRREERAGCTQPDDRRAARALAVCFAALAVSVAVGAVHALVTHEVPSTSALGIGVTTAALIAMPVLARAKRRVAPALGSRAQEREAGQTDLCALLAGVVLVGLLLRAAFGWWWADSVAALVVAGLAAFETRRSWRAESLEDTCCS